MPLKHLKLFILKRSLDTQNYQVTCYKVFYGLFNMIHNYFPIIYPGLFSGTLCGEKYTLLICPFAVFSFPILPDQLFQILPQLTSTSYIQNHTLSP